MPVIFLRRLTLVLGCLIAGWQASVVLAQPTLDRLEKGPAATVPPGANKAAPVQAYLGLIGDDRQESGRGIRVLDTLPGGPADQAGIRPGDLIVAIDDIKTRNMNELAERLARHRPGDKLAVAIERDRTIQKQHLVLGLRPPQPTNNSGSPAAGEVEPRRRLLGIRTVPVSEEVRKLYNLQSVQGALVSEVLVGSPAHAAGVPLDAVIVEAQGQPIAAPEDLAQLLAGVGPGQEIELGYLSRGTLTRKKIKLDSAPVAAARPIGPATTAAAPISDRERIERLESRIEQLERQLQQVLDELQRDDPAATSNSQPPL